MTQFNNIKDLFKHIKKQVQDSLENEVANTVEYTMQKHIQNDVYDAYEPKKYVRFEFDGGLIADENIVSRPIKDGIEVENITTHDGKYIPEVIETGEGYTYGGYDYAFEKPRPFVANTIEDLEKNKQHIKTLERSLNKKGIKTI